MIQENQTFSRKAAKVAVLSLIKEVELTPKPGLVDMANTGAHQDLSIQLMRKSAESLAETFEEIAFISYGRSPSQAVREEIAAIGRVGEKRMFEATADINTHKGAIWAIGLLISAAAMGKGTYQIEKIVSIAGEIALFPDRECPVAVTNGGRITAKYDVGGARGEAQQGFPHIIRYSLPMLKQSRRLGMSEEAAQLKSLLSLIAHLDDTCILHRGGSEALVFAKSQAAGVLANGNLEALKTLDKEFIKRNISPGGSADLLAATLFLDEIQASMAVHSISNELTYTH